MGDLLDLSPHMAFVVFEGLDGAGKSTLMAGLVKWLESQNIQVVTTREPGGSELGDKLRQLLLFEKNPPPGPRTELLIYEAARSHHVEMVIRPRLQAGAWVVCDRFTASSLAFQWGARGLKRSDVEWLNEWATQGLKPDLTVLIDLEVKESLSRLKRREREGQTLDRFEQETQDFHQRVRSTYLQLAAEQPQAWLILDGGASSEKMLEHIKAHLSQVMRVMPKAGHED